MTRIVEKEPLVSHRESNGMTMPGIRNLAVSFAVPFCLCFLAVSTARGQCDDPYDRVLCAYALDHVEEALFSGTDGEISAFWTNWAGRDEIPLEAPHDCI
jgi:hypothetical protein